MAIPKQAILISCTQDSESRQSDVRSFKNFLRTQSYDFDCQLRENPSKEQLDQAVHLVLSQMDDNSILLIYFSGSATISKDYEITINIGQEELNLPAYILESKEKQLRKEQVAFIYDVYSKVETHHCTDHIWNIDNSQELKMISIYQETNDKFLKQEICLQNTEVLIPYLQGATSASEKHIIERNLIMAGEYSHQRLKSDKMQLFSLKNFLLSKNCKPEIQAQAVQSSSTVATSNNMEHIQNYYSRIVDSVELTKGDSDIKIRQVYCHNQHIPYFIVLIGASAIKLFKDFKLIFEHEFKHELVDYDFIPGASFFAFIVEDRSNLSDITKEVKVMDINTLKYVIYEKQYFLEQEEIMTVRQFNSMYLLMAGKKQAYLFKQYEYDTNLLVYAGNFFNFGYPQYVQIVTRWGKFQIETDKDKAFVYVMQLKNPKGISCITSFSKKTNKLQVTIDENTYHGYYLRGNLALKAKNMRPQITEAQYRYFDIDNNQRFYFIRDDLKSEKIDYKNERELQASAYKGEILLKDQRTQVTKTAFSLIYEDMKFGHWVSFNRGGLDCIYATVKDKNSGAQSLVQIEIDFELMAI